MPTTHRRHLPLEPILTDYFNHRLPTTTPGIDLRSLIEDASAFEWQTQLVAWAETLRGFYHIRVVEANAPFLRHAITYLVRGEGHVADRYTQCCAPPGNYFVAGVGRSFWGAVVPFADPGHLPNWSAEVERGMHRTGYLKTAKGACLADACETYATVLRRHSSLTASDLDCVFFAIAHAIGRECDFRSRERIEADDKKELFRAVRTVRSARPLRRRLADAEEVTAAESRSAAAMIDDAIHSGLGEDAAAFLVEDLRDHYRRAARIHPSEFCDLMHELARAATPNRPDGFGGFCSDSFRFFDELAANNRTGWMAENRARYRFAVREPLVELGRLLAERYVGPVLSDEYGWPMVADPRPGRTLTNIARNDYGRGVPYHDVVWLTYYPADRGTRRDNPQLFVRLSADGLRYGFLLPRTARAAGQRLRRAIQDDAESVWQSLRTSVMDSGISFTTDERFADTVELRGPENLREWATGRSPTAGVFRPATDIMLRRDELIGDILLTFDRLLPLFATALEPAMTATYARRAAPTYDAAAFARDTYLPEHFLDRALGLLRMKRQLALSGPGGTGKTHVARCLARALIGGRPANAQFVQFHPGYTYADFVEGPTGDGLLLTLAATAAVRPTEAFALVIDELNRGDLVTVFGEAFSLLEHRDQPVTLPRSKREFRLPANLYLIGTFGPPAADAPDPGAAVRRRFAVIDLKPDAAVLARWFADHPPADPDPTFGPRVVRLFERLNLRLLRDLGPAHAVGHSHFMIPDLDADRLNWVWEHTVRPLTAGRDYALDRFAEEVSPAAS